jgi:phosphopentomutase
VLALGGRSVDLGTRGSLADIGQTVAEVFGCRVAAGESFLGAIAG